MNAIARMLGGPGIFLLGLLAPSATSAAGTLGAPSQEAVDAAIAAPLIHYNRNLSGGAHTHGAFHGGASVLLAVAAHLGNTSADARLLQQMRHTITGGNDITANGGYPAQHERHVTGTYAIARRTPRIWDQLTAAEKNRIDLTMKAALVASAFTTSDSNPHIAAGTQQYALDGDANLHRSWNPNFREGMIGGVLVGMSYFGGAAAATEILDNYNHASFVSELSSAGLTNIHQTFNWKAANPSSNAPSGTKIQNAVRNYRLFGSPLSSHMAIYQSLSTDTYGKNVIAGLNGGAGIGGAGRILSGADTLPNPGAPGMLKEFDSVDGGGPRSSAHYAYDGLRPHQTNQLALIVGGLWPAADPVATAAVARMETGNTDFWYKIEKGYSNYSAGKAQGVFDLSLSATYGFVYNRAVWEEVLKPFHGLGPGGGPPPLFPAGTRVLTTAPVVVGASAGGAALGDQANGAFGTIVEGPAEDGEGDQWWRVDFDEGPDGWCREASLTEAPVSDFLTTSPGGAWRNRALEPMSGRFGYVFNMRADAAGIDAVTGFSASSAAAYSDLAVILRFSNTGAIDARNGGVYQAANPLAYSPGVTYRVTLTIDTGSGRYSATVAPPTGDPVLIADDYAFRSEQSGVASLANLAAFAEGGSHTTSGLTIHPRPSPPTGLRPRNRD